MCDSGFSSGDNNFSDSNTKSNDYAKLHRKEVSGKRGKGKESCEEGSAKIKFSSTDDSISKCDTKPKSDTCPNYSSYNWGSSSSSSCDCSECRGSGTITCDSINNCSTKEDECSEGANDCKCGKDCKCGQGKDCKCKPGECKGCKCSPNGTGKICSSSPYNMFLILLLFSYVPLLFVLALFLLVAAYIGLMSFWLAVILFIVALIVLGVSIGVFAAIYSGKC